jgi:hypothetical protein
LREGGGVCPEIEVGLSRLSQFIGFGHWFMQRDLDNELVRMVCDDALDMEQVRQLISDGANVNAKDEDGFSVLWHAVASRYSQKAVVELLLECGASMEQEKDDLLYIACETVPFAIEAPDIIGLLLSKGADPNVIVNSEKETLLDMVEHFQSCFLKWSKEGREGCSEPLEEISAVMKLLADAGGKRAEEMSVSSI